MIQHIATLASIYKADEYKYPKQKLDDSWEKVLLNQCTEPFPLFALRRLDSFTISVQSMMVRCSGSLCLICANTVYRCSPPGLRYVRSSLLLFPVCNS